ncbi:unnamed protein product [Calypogeia fissa]
MCDCVTAPVVRFFIFHAQALKVRTPPFQTASLGATEFDNKALKVRTAPFQTASLGATELITRYRLTRQKLSEERSVPCDCVILAASGQMCDCVTAPVVRFFIFHAHALKVRTPPFQTASLGATEFHNKVAEARSR